jgi:hypothetical protein
MKTHDADGGDRTLAETQTGAMKARWSSTKNALSRMPLWRPAMAVGAFLAATAAIVVLLLDLARGRGLDAAQVLYGLILAAVGYVGYAVSKQSVLNGSVVAGVAGIGLLLVGEGMLAVLAGLLLLVGAIWAFATSYEHAAPRLQSRGTP